MEVHRRAPEPKNNIHCLHDFQQLGNLSGRSAQASAAGEFSSSGFWGFGFLGVLGALIFGFWGDFGFWGSQNKLDVGGWGLSATVLHGTTQQGGSCATESF